MAGKNYLGLLNDDKTMIEHLVLYIDDYDDGGRKVYVPLLEKEFKSEDGLGILFEAFDTIERKLRWKGGTSRSFVMPAWRGERQPIQHNIPFDFKNRKRILDSGNQILEEFEEKLLKNQKKSDPEVQKIINENFWDLL